MLEAFSKKLKSIISLPPTEENERLIRELSHRFINEVRQYSESEGYLKTESTVKKCYSHIEKLNRNMIMTRGAESFKFAECDIGYAVGNCVIASDTLLCKSSSVLTFQSPPPIYSVCCYKLIVKAVTVIAETLLRGGGNTVVEFRCKKLPHASLLLAYSDNNNHAVFADKKAAENLKILVRIADLHRGACVHASTRSGAYIAISISDFLESNSKPVRIPSYIDLLLDKVSDIYVGLSNIDEIHFRD